MKEIKIINENSYLGVFKNIVYKENYRNYEIFVTKNTFDLPSHLKINPYFNGYIVIPKGCKYYEKPCFKIDEKIDIHGGFTFSEMIRGTHVIGFDTLHGFDNERTQNVDFVLKQLRNAVDQIINKEKENKKI